MLGVKSPEREIIIGQREPFESLSPSWMNSRHVICEVLRPVRELRCTAIKFPETFRLFIDGFLVSHILDSAVLVARRDESLWLHAWGGGGVWKSLSNGEGAACAGALHVAGGADGIVGAGGTAELDAAPAPTNGDVGTAPAPTNGDVGAGLCDPCAFRERACSAAWARASCGGCGSAADC